MELGFTTAAYIVAAILFILALGGLSGQESAKRAVWYGIIGMALAVFATLYVLVLPYFDSGGLDKRMKAVTTESTKRVHIIEAAPPSNREPIQVRITLPQPNESGNAGAASDNC